MKRLFALWPCLLLLLCASPGFSPRASAQTTPDELIGKWTGKATYNGESKLYAVRFERDKQEKLVMFFSIPEMRFHDFGPAPLVQDGDLYKNKYFSFRLSPDRQSMTGTMSFDGHELALELKRGEAPPKLAPQPLAGRTPSPVWTFKAGGPIWSSPTVADGTVYFGSNDGNVYALNAKSGKLVWQHKTEGPVMGRPTVEGQHLYVLSDDGNLYKLERASGRPVWKFDTHGGAVARDLPGPKSETYDYQMSAPVVAGGTVYVGSADKRVYAVEAETGRERWHFETQGIVRSTPAVAGGLVFFGSYDHHIYAVEAQTGALKWKLDTLQAVVSSPLVEAGTVYIGSRSSDLFALDAATGKVKWKFFYWSSWVESAARLHKGILYIGSSDHQQMFAIAAATGKRIWNSYTDGSAWSTPAVTDKLVYIGVVGVKPYFIEHHGNFLAVDRATGQVVWRFPLSPIPGSVTYGVASSPAVDRGLVYFGSLDGTFYAFRTEG
jgi:eukaryotic-like serine/threonine-protein kinase